MKHLATISELENIRARQKQWQDKEDKFWRDALHVQADLAAAKEREAKMAAETKQQEEQLREKRLEQETPPTTAGAPRKRSHVTARRLPSRKSSGKQQATKKLPLDKPEEDKLKKEFLENKKKEHETPERERDRRWI